MSPACVRACVAYSVQIVCMQSVVRTALRYVRCGTLRACISTDSYDALRTLYIHCVELEISLIHCCRRHASSSCIKIWDQHGSDYRIFVISNFNIFFEGRPNQVSIQTASMVTHSLAQPIIPAQSLPPSLLFITFVGSRHYNIWANTILLLIITYLLGP